jgi:hypothetical protein
MNFIDQSLLMFLGFDLINSGFIGSPKPVSAVTPRRFVLFRCIGVALEVSIDRPPAVFCDFGRIPVLADRRLEEDSSCSHWLVGR